MPAKHWLQRHTLGDLIMYALQSQTTVSRLFTTLPLAGLITLGLFFVMARLVHMDRPIVELPPPPQIPAVVYEPRVIVDYKTPRPEPVVPVEPVPPTPVERWVPPEKTGTPLSYLGPVTPEPRQLGGVDSLPFARVMAPPVYPARAMQRGIEGFVDVRFDVTASGATQNVRVIYAEPAGVFDQAAQSAVARWRFQPRMVDGKPEAFEGLSKRVRFNLEKS
jgi:protein TonB